MAKCLERAVISTHCLSLTHSNQVYISITIDPLKLLLRSSMSLIFQWVSDPSSSQPMSSKWPSLEDSYLCFQETTLLVSCLISLYPPPDSSSSCSYSVGFLSLGRGPRFRCGSFSLWFLSPQVISFSPMTLPKYWWLHNLTWDRDSDNLFNISRSNSEILNLTYLKQKCRLTPQTCFLLPHYCQHPLMYSVIAQKF